MTEGPKRHILHKDFDGILKRRVQFSLFNLFLLVSVLMITAFFAGTKIGGVFNLSPFAMFRAGTSDFKMLSGVKCTANADAQCFGISCDYLGRSPVEGSCEGDKPYCCSKRTLEQPDCDAGVGGQCFSEYCDNLSRDIVDGYCADDSKPFCCSTTVKPSSNPLKRCQAEGGKCYDKPCGSLGRDDVEGSCWKSSLYCCSTTVEVKDDGSCTCKSAVPVACGNSSNGCGYGERKYSYGCQSDAKCTKKFYCTDDTACGYKLNSCPSNVNCSRSCKGSFDSGQCGDGSNGCNPGERVVTYDNCENPCCNSEVKKCVSDNRCLAPQYTNPGKRSTPTPDPRGSSQCQGCYSLNGECDSTDARCAMNRCCDSIINNAPTATPTVKPATKVPAPDTAKPTVPHTVKTVNCTKGASCDEIYQEACITSSGESGTKWCNKKGTCIGDGGGTMCSWGGGSYCEDCVSNGSGGGGGSTAKELRDDCESCSSGGQCASGTCNGGKCGWAKNC